MAAAITVTDIKALEPGTQLPDSVLSQFIAVVDQADTCLDANSITEDVQKLLKSYGAAHLAAAASRGNVESESSPTGASRKYRGSQSKNPLDTTQWGQQLQLLDSRGCVTNLLQTSQSLLIAAPGPGGNQGNGLPYNKSQGTRNY